MPLVLALAAILFLLVGAPAKALQPLTDVERAELRPAIAAHGCTGGKIEVEKEKYRVEGAKCGDGRRYVLEFNAGFVLTNKELE
ncbi:hypothetical protein CU048_02800 [Beijerinckiaceae bacterium]|nr:hypothetical protein CU048_02800 [Beijerinckiaceae bacterium]